jgi:hypothetical protein
VKSRLLIAIVALLAVGAFFAGRSYSDDQKSEGMQMTDEQKAQYETYMKYATPGAQHKAMEPLVGSWDLSTKFWMDANSPMQESKGTATAKWILGGRYIQEDVTGDMGGMPFHGTGFTGYDLMKGEYISIWMDEMSTCPMWSTGQVDVAGKVFTFSGTYPDAMQNMKEVTYKTVVKVTMPDQHVMEMYMVGDDGKEFKNMEITYTRKKQL